MNATVAIREFRHSEAAIKAAKLPAYRYDPSTERYRDLASGRFLTFREVYGVLDIKESVDQIKLVDLARAFKAGQIPEGVWHMATLDLLRRAHVQAAAIGAGGFGRIRPSTFIRIDNALRDDSMRLVAFAKQIPGMADGQIQHRIGLYVGHARAQFERARPGPQIKDKLNWMSVERRVLIPGDNCEWCIHLADQSWQPYGLLPYPGEVDDAWYGKACLTNCRCQMERRTIKRTSEPRYVKMVYKPLPPEQVLGEKAWSPDQPRWPAGSPQGGEFRAVGIAADPTESIGDAFNRIPAGRATTPETKKWRKEMQARYDSDPEFRATVDALTLYTEGDFDGVRESVVYAVTGKFTSPEEIEYGGFFRKKIQENTSLGEMAHPMAEHKLFFKNQNITGPTAPVKAQEAGKALARAVRDADPIEVPLYRGVQGSHRPDADPAELAGTFEQRWAAYDRPTIKIPPDHQVGDIINIFGTTSFTSDQVTAERFSVGAARGQPKKRDMPNYSVTYEIRGPVKAINASAVSPWDQKEYVTGGQFEVVSVEHFGGDSSQWPYDGSWGDRRFPEIRDFYRPEHYHYVIQQTGVWDVPD